jgi:hypothetical protein
MELLVVLVEAVVAANLQDQVKITLAWVVVTKVVVLVA